MVPGQLPGQFPVQLFIGDSDRVVAVRFGGANDGLPDDADPSPVAAVAVQFRGEFGVGAGVFGTR